MALGAGPASGGLEPEAGRGERGGRGPEPLGSGLGCLSPRRPARQRVSPARAPPVPPSRPAAAPPKMAAGSQDGGCEGPPAPAPESYECVRGWGQCPGTTGLRGRGEAAEPLRPPIPALGPRLARTGSGRQRGAGCGLAPTGGLAMRRLSLIHI